VLVDPALAKEIYTADSDIAYLFRKQIEEADMVCLSKSDLYDGGTELPGISIQHRLSAKTGDGVAAWLDEVLGGTLPVASQALTIDYDRYTHAEAALGWLNARVLADLEEPLSPAVLAGPLFDGLDEALTAAGARSYVSSLARQVPRSTVCGVLSRRIPQHAQRARLLLLLA
jgi:hypothetical protein